MVTDRMAPVRVDGRTIHQIWMPYHWGQTGITTGDVVNDLMGAFVDPNVFIQESKVLTCDIRPGRRPGAGPCWSTSPTTGAGPGSPRKPACRS